MRTASAARLFEAAKILVTTTLDPTLQMKYKHNIT